MKLWSVKTQYTYIEILARKVYTDTKLPNVIWADGVRIAFSEPVYYVEEI